MLQGETQLTKHLSTTDQTKSTGMQESQQQVTHRLGKKSTTNIV
jgi:hypothetical protein